MYRKISEKTVHSPKIMFKKDETKKEWIKELKKEKRGKKQMKGLNKETNESRKLKKASRTNKQINSKKHVSNQSHFLQTSILVQFEPWKIGPSMYPGLMTTNSNFCSSGNTFNALSFFTYSILTRCINVRKNVNLWGFGGVVVRPLAFHF